MLYRHATNVLIHTGFILTVLVSACLNPQNRWTRGNIGVVLLDEDNAVAIERILPRFDSPPDGFLPGDILVEVDGYPMTGLPAEAVEQALTGPVGGSVRIILQRDNELREYSVLRIMDRKPSRQRLRSRLLRVTKLTEEDSFSIRESQETADETL